MFKKKRKSLNEKIEKKIQKKKKQQTIKIKIQKKTQKKREKF